MAESSDEVADGPVQTATADGMPSAPTSDEIRSQIEQTRAEMSDTIDAIQSRLNPKRVLTDARAALTDAAVGRVRHLTRRTYGPDGVLQRVRDNPLPFVLIASAAAGVLVLAMTNQKRRRQRRRMSRQGPFNT